MAKCEWCKRETQNIVDVQDSMMNDISICSKCNENYVEKHICRKCKKVISININGLCTQCLQVETLNENKRKQQALMGVIENDVINKYGELVSQTSDDDFTDDDFDRFMQIDRQYTFGDMQKSHELKFIWVLVKLSATGLYDNDTLNKLIQDNLADIEDLLDAHLKDIYEYLNSQTGLNRRCKLIIDCNSDTRRIIKKASNILANKNNIYILQLPNDEY